MAYDMRQDIERVLIPREQIAARISEMAEQINRDYEGKELVMVGILKGAVMFFTELFLQVKLPVAIDFMSISSYGMSTKSSGVVRILKDLDKGVENKHVLVVEDIVDTGLSLKYIMENLSVRGPASVKVCALLDKPSRRKTEVPVAYRGFAIPDAFAVGFGLDYAELYRNLPDICELKRSIYTN
jgi:hypoxanthine phosphoribosyltransferase